MLMPISEKSKGIIRWKSLQKMLGGISRSSIDRWEKTDSFPSRVRLGKNSIGWHLNAVEQWILERTDIKREEAIS